MKIINSTSLTRFAEIIANNFESFTHNNNSITEVAEAINQGFDSLLYYFARPDLKDIKIWAAYMMGFGSYSAWITAYILTASGHFDSGLADIRRATEFACYAAKVIKDEERAWAWIEQKDDPKSQRLFASSCAIPLSYLSDDYKFLRPL